MSKISLAHKTVTRAPPPTATISASPTSSAFKNSWKYSVHLFRTLLSNNNPSFTAFPIFPRSLPFYRFSEHLFVRFKILIQSHTLPGISVPLRTTRHPLPLCPLHSTLVIVYHRHLLQPSLKGSTYTPPNCAHVTHLSNISSTHLWTSLILAQHYFSALSHPVYSTSLPIFLIPQSSSSSTYFPTLMSTTAS